MGGRCKGVDATKATEATDATDATEAGCRMAPGPTAREID
jgi:hypothetical protein